MSTLPLAQGRHKACPYGGTDILSNGFRRLFQSFQPFALNSH